LCFLKSGKRAASATASGVTAPVQGDAGEPRMPAELMRIGDVAPSFVEGDEAAAASGVARFDRPAARWCGGFERLCWCAS
jgi:hypothetical protein